jgi:hypothetical protein
MIHVRKCCKGKCTKCGRWFRRGLELHIVICEFGVKPITSKHGNG